MLCYVGFIMAWRLFMAVHLTPILLLNCLQYKRIFLCRVDLGSENLNILKRKRLC